MVRKRLVFTAVVMLLPNAAIATETVSYSYDAKGRLVQVVHSGTVNNGVSVQYTHDHADNRTHVTVSGASH